MGKRKRRRKKQTCYMCRKVATSREHVPPICFFPEKTVLSERLDLRKNLITVPSCEDHNIRKSGDDEYLLAIVTTHIENNPIAQELFRTKVIRAIIRRPWLIPGFFKNMFPVKVGGIQTGGFHIDRERFDRSFDQMSRGIYYHHFCQKMELPSANMTYSMVDISSEKKDDVNAALIEWRNYSTNAYAQVPKHGENPVVYYYQVLEDEESDSAAIRHVFYEGVVVDVLFGAMNELSNSVSAA